jgi:hypothetical protein
LFDLRDFHDASPAQSNPVHHRNPINPVQTLHCDLFDLRDFDDA